LKVDLQNKRIVFKKDLMEKKLQYFRIIKILNHSKEIIRGFYKVLMSKIHGI